jgi:alginate O-acetyltransferase complex protein AlgI
MQEIAELAPHGETRVPQNAAQRRPHWWQGWCPLLSLPLAVFLLVPADWPRWGFMWLLAFAIYLGCKWLTWRRRRVVGASVGRHLGYLFLWPGLDANAFLSPKRLPAGERPSALEWLFALAKLLLGLALLFVVVHWLAPGWPDLVGWVGMVGVIFVLHFGSFHLLSCAWRAGGVEARPLMNWPAATPGVSDFWGRRWNTAFRDLTHRFLFRPLAGRFGPRWALLLGFLFSGLLHELVITFPAGGGYGGPTVFFLLQAVAILLERSASGRAAGLGKGWRGRFFTGTVLLLPVSLLFPPEFVRGIIVPFLKVIGAV